VIDFDDLPRVLTCSTSWQQCTGQLLETSSSLLAVMKRVML